MYLRIGSLGFVFLLQLGSGCGGDALHPVSFTTELCDGDDNDGDPATPDGAEEPLFGKSCDGDDSDLCSDGIWVCAAGVMTCNDSPDDALELCDGIDNDCNAATADGSDEASESCDGADADLCPEGNWTCDHGNRVCSDDSGDTQEVCDGIDNDCDSTTADGSDVLVVPTLTTCPTSWDRRPIVEFSHPLPFDHTYALYKDDDSTPYGTVTSQGQNYFRPPAPLAAGSAAPGTETSIYAVACTGSGIQCCGVTNTVSVSLVESCSQPLTPTTSNILISEYVINGDGACPGEECEAGEAFEITNLSYCPVSLDGFHFSYCSPNGCSAIRWMDFNETSVVPPRGVYVAARNLGASACEYPFFGANDPGLFGLNVSVLEMQSNESLASGWFNNNGGGYLRIAAGAFVSMTQGTTYAEVEHYSGAATTCESFGLDAWNACGNPTYASLPDTVLAPNQLGRLWHPCDAVVDPKPTSCRY